jgi:hypothetical protein
MTETEVETKIGRWLKAAPSKIGTDEFDDNFSDDER